MEVTTLEAKVVVLGTQGVGKTSLVIRFVGNMFSPGVSPTIGASFFTYKMNIENYRVKLQVWDTAGQERFRAMAPMYYRNANAALLIYDITSTDSFHDMKKWITELKRNVDTPLVMCVLGNKSDLELERKVSTSEASDFAYNLDCAFHETSALTNEGVQEAFLDLGKQLIRLYKSNPHCGLVPSGLYNTLYISDDHYTDVHNLSDTTNETTTLDKQKQCSC